MFVQRIAGSQGIALACMLCLLPALALAQDTPAAPGELDVRWFGHEEVVDLAARGDRTVTVGRDGLVMLWQGEHPTAWRQLADARHVVPRSDGWRVVGADQTWLLDNELIVVGEPAAAARPTRCRGAGVVWWWDGGALHVDGVHGSGVVEELVAPLVPTRCSVTSTRAALTWFDDGHALIAQLQREQPAYTRVPYQGAGDPIATPAASGWDVAERVGDRVRSCDTFDDTGRPVPCRWPERDVQAFLLPRTLPITWASATASLIVAADVQGWTTVTRNHVRRHAPDGWRTYGLVGERSIVGCRVSADAAHVEVRDAAGDVVDSQAVPEGSCPERAWVDGAAASVTTSVAVLDWDADGRSWRVRPRGDARFASAAQGPARRRFEIRERWSAICGSHRELWQITGDHEAPVDVRGVSCGAWTHLESTGGGGAGAFAAEGEPLTLGAGAEPTLSCELPPGPGRLPDRCGGTLPLPGDATLTSTTSGPYLSGPEGFWAARSLRRYAVLATDAPRSGDDLPRASGWWSHAPERVLRMYAAPQ